MTFKIQSTQSVGVQGVKVLCYGRAASGKTRMCATAPSPIIFSAENGLLSLRKQNIPFVEIDNMAKLDEVYKWVTTSREARNFQTFCLDSISEIAEKVLIAELARTPDPRKAYGEMARETFKKIKQFRDIPGPNVFFTAKEEFEKDDTYGGMLFQPSFPGRQLGQNAPYDFDEVFRLTICKNATTGENFSALQTRPDPTVTAKDRSGSLDLWEEPNLTNIFRKISA